MKAIIGGTGVYTTDYSSKKEKIETKFGDIEINTINIDGEQIVFLARHGEGHTKPPHLINYKANIMGLKEYGVKYIYATAAVGSCNKKFQPGDIVIIKDFLDFTKSRSTTFFDGEDEIVRHVDMSDPYCSNMRKKFSFYSDKLNLDIKGEAVYICTEGPRFETSSEIKMFKDYGDVVGMTSVPEVTLAKELGLCYSSVGIVTNWCTGLSEDIILHDIKNAIEKNKENITNVFIKVFKEGLDQNNCNCKNSIIQL